MEIRPYVESDREAAIDLVMTRTPQLPRFVLDTSLDSEHIDLSPNLVAVDAADRPQAWAVLVKHEGLPPGRRFVAITVSAGVEGSGVGSELHRRLLQGVTTDVTQLNASVFDDDERSIAIAKHWGYEAYEHAFNSRFDLVNLPTPDLSPSLALEPCGDLEFDDRSAVEDMLGGSQTNPEAKTGFVVDLPALLSFADGGKPVGVLARLEGVPVGIAHGSVRDDLLAIGYLCVQPAARGRGIAVAMKQQFHLEAQRLGATRVKTTNEEKNVQIRTLNAKLGYEVEHGEIRFRRRP